MRAAILSGRLARSVAILAAALLVHAAALGAGLIWLDHAHIEAGAAIAPPGRFFELFTRGFAGTGFYRPLMALSLSIDAIAGSPLAYHATSLLWHGVASLATAAAAEALGLSRRAATLAALLFAVHPASVAARRESPSASAAAAVASDATPCQRRLVAW